MNMDLSKVKKAVEPEVSVNDISRIIGEMSEGNLTVDVSQNRDFYIGDLNAIAESLGKLNVLNSDLVELMHNISVAADHIHSGSGQVATGSNYLSKASVEQTESIETLASNIRRIEKEASRKRRKLLRCP